jgi:hypothetical protein
MATTTPTLTPSAKAITDKGASFIHVDTDTDGLNTTNINKGIKFDVFGNGTSINTGWGNNNDGLLALDKNGNGKIDNGTELFGGAIGAGFAKLAALDTNKDGIIDAKDSDFPKLQIWTDLNQNGVTNPGELKSLTDSAVASLNLGYTNDFKTINNGNLFGETSTAKTTNGKSLSIVDVYYPTEEVNPSLVTPPAATPVTTPAPKTLNDFKSAMDIGIPSLKQSFGKEFDRIKESRGANNIAKIDGNIMGEVNNMFGDKGFPTEDKFQVKSDVFAPQMFAGKS